MTQEQKNIFIASAFAILIVGGIFYFKKRGEPALPEEIETAVEENKVSKDDTELTKEEILQNEVNKANAEELKAQEAVKKIKWETAMKSATSAFGKGDYDRAIAFYNEALSYYKDRDEPYSGLFSVYNVQNNVDQARVAIEAAIRLNPLFTEHWKSKLILLDEKTNVSFADLKKVYEEGILKVDPVTKGNLVVYFASMAGRNGEKAEAVSLWEYAKELYPDNSAIYQAEIDRLQGS